MAKLNQRDMLSWLAGFYEGEGSIGTYTRGSRQVDISLNVTQKEQQPLELFKEYFNVGNICRNRKESDRECYQFQTSGMNAVKIILELSPFMRSERKRKQALDALNLYFNRKNIERKNYSLKSIAAMSRPRDENGTYLKVPTDKVIS